MHNPGKHSVFVLDGNTGKTTTIELLRWCFLYKESEARGKFRHMWNDPAHVLDHDIEGSQECSISIDFKDQKHTYRFTRKTVGEYDNNTDEEGQIIGDKISNIEDILEIDRGGEIRKGDQANIYLNSKFRFNECAEYFCFDGEKAKNVLILASDRKNLDFVEKMINTRATHPILNKYVKTLDRLQQKVYDKARSKVTDQGKTRKLNDLIKLNAEKEECIEENRELNLKYEILDKRITEDENTRDEIRRQLIENATDNQRKRDDYAQQFYQAIQIILENRNDLYRHSRNWISHIDKDYINALKYYIRESGKLPDPYYDDLIQECLLSNQCKICGRDLDEGSITWIKKIEKLTASHEVQTFLLGELFIDEKIISPIEIYNDIVQKSEEIEFIKNARDSIKMSDIEKKLRENEKEYDFRIKQNEGELHAIEVKIKINKEKINECDQKINEIEKQIDQIEDYKTIIDSVKKTRQTIEQTQDSLKEKTTKIISDVLSESVSSILGPNFSAQFSKERGLLLGENGRYSPEIGGMSGRLILSYTFAETMTFIDPIIIDTPSGNVGTHREALAKHLAVNHRQVICLCLPTELDKFAPFLVNENEIVTVNNETRGA